MLVCIVSREQLKGGNGWVEELVCKTLGRGQRVGGHGLAELLTTLWPGSWHLQIIPHVAGQGAGAGTVQGPHALQSMGPQCQ